MPDDGPQRPRTLFSMRGTTSDRRVGDEKSDKARWGAGGSSASEDGVHLEGAASPVPGSSDRVFAPPDAKVGGASSKQQPAKIKEALKQKSRFFYMSSESCVVHGLHDWSGSEWAKKFEMHPKAAMKFCMEFIGGEAHEFDEPHERFEAALTWRVDADSPSGEETPTRGEGLPKPLGLSLRGGVLRGRLSKRFTTCVALEFIRPWVAFVVLHTSQ